MLSKVLFTRFFCNVCFKDFLATIYCRLIIQLLSFVLVAISISKHLNCCVFESPRDDKDTDREKERERDIEKRVEL